MLALRAIAFDAYVHYSAHVSFNDPDSYYRDDDDGELHARGTISGTVEDSAAIRGVAKLSVEEDWTRIESVVLLELDGQDISVRGYPESEHGDYNDDYDP